MEVRVLSRAPVTSDLEFKELFCSSKQVMIDISVQNAIGLLRKNVAVNNELKSLLNKKGRSIIALKIDPNKDSMSSILS